MEGSQRLDSRSPVGKEPFEHFDNFNSRNRLVRSPFRKLNIGVQRVHCRYVEAEGLALFGNNIDAEWASTSWAILEKSVATNGSMKPLSI